MHSDAPLCGAEIRSSIRLVIGALLAGWVLSAVVSALAEWDLALRLSLAASALVFASLIVERFGHFRQAFYFAFLATVAVNAYSAYLQAGLRNIGLPVLPVLVIIAGFLLDGVIVAICTATAIAALALMLLLRRLILGIPVGPNDPGDLAILTIITALAGLCGFLLARQLRASLLRLSSSELAARHSEAALREADRNLLLLANNLSEMVLAYDMDRRLIFVNAACERLTGYSTAELHSRQFICWVHPADRARMLGHWERLFLGGSIRDEEYRIITRLGAIRWASATWGPLYDESGRQVGIQGSERDITEHRALREQFAQAQRMESLGRLASGIAHDFNNLLTVINGYTSLLLASSTDTATRSALAEVEKAAGTAADLTRNLLTFSRGHTLPSEPVDLNAVIDATSSMLRRIIGARIALETSLTPGLGAILACKGEISQILVNLAVNARDAMPSGGRLLIETKPLVLGPDSPHAAPGSYLLLTVSDTGAGMDDATVHRIFEPFFTTKPEGTGTGLGLSIVYSTVKRWNGFITVASSPGAGATFQIGIPALA